MTLTFWREGLAIALVAILAGCATRATTLDSQWVAPQFAGSKTVRSLLVMGVVRDTATRRNFEDRMVSALTEAGVRAVPGYTVLPDDGPVAEDRLRQAVIQAGVTHVLVSQIVNVSQEVRVTPGTVTGPAWGRGVGPGPGWGRGWGGFHGYHSSVWGPPVVSTPPRVTTTQNVHADTRLFDAREADVLWAAATTTSLGFDSVRQIVDQFVALIVTTLKRDAII